MSKSQNPLTGQMSGSMANFVTTTHGGQNVIRSKAFNPRDANSAAQQAQRQYFKMIVDEYKSWGGITDLGFCECVQGQSAYNLFMATNLSNAIDKSGPIPVIDYRKLLVANGSLPGVTVLPANISSDGIVINYQTNLKIPRVSDTDEMVAIAKTTQGELLLERKQRGSDEVGTIQILFPNLSVANLQCCYLFVRNMDGSKSSKSVSVQFSEAY